LTPRRKWLFRLCAVVLVPLLALGGLEAALRLAGYGHPTGFFKKIHVGQKKFLITNEDFGLRFFPPQMTRLPLPILMEAEKPPDTCRIFILGESAARGDPAPPFGAGRYLEVLLRERFPGEHFEVINLGMTAINSHVIVSMARECARDQGDLWIIYMGNNEMVGPFGAATVFGAQTPPPGLVRLNLAIQRSRVGQLMMALTRRLQGKAGNSAWGGMKMFLGNQLRPDDSRKEAVYRNFQHNLKDIAAAGLDSGARVILNTVAVNLKDCPPFASLSATNLPAADRAAGDRWYADGSLAEGQGNFEEAAKCFEQAARLDPQMSDRQFHWAECLLHLTNFTAAREHFQLACDYDALPFRADSRINSLIRQTGRQLAGPHLVLFDAAAAMATNNPAGICGGESFYEHVHFNFDGNYRLGRAWAEQIEPLLPAPVRNRAVSGWVSQETCEQRLGLTDWNRSLVFAELVRRLKDPPLCSQANNARRLETFQEAERELRRKTNAAAVARAVYLDAIRRAPDDYYLHENFGKFLAMVGDLEQATAEGRRIIELAPQNGYNYFQLGVLLAAQGRLAEAQSAFNQAVALRPGLIEAWLQLGHVHLVERKFELALQELERARELDPRNASYCIFVSEALLKLNRRDEARQHCREALQLDPACLEAHFMLGNILVAEKKIPEAQREYETVIRLQPTNVLAHLDVGVTLALQTRFDDAVRQFEEALRLDPSNRLARAYLDRTRALQNRQP
jgi:tetratricopeptide (TPR) repeat protein